MMGVINGLYEHYGVIVYVILAALVVFIMVKLFNWCDRTFTKIVHRNKPSIKRDESRVFTKKMKNQALKKCHYRCEGTGVLWRCFHKGDDLHGDHWYPHSRGGATSEQNLVMLCPKCNRKKSDKIPTHWQTWALKGRRRRGRGYSPGVYVKPGEWLPRAYVNKSVYAAQQREMESRRRPTF